MDDVNLDYFSSPYQVVSAAIIFVSGLFLSVFFGKNFHLSMMHSVAGYFWHTTFCLVYLAYAENFGADAITYYYYGQAGWWDFSFGTSAIRVISSALVSGLGLSIVGVFLIFNIIGSIGFFAFWGSLKKATFGKNQLIKLLGTLIIFLPSLSFWSSALGKDSISFMAAGLALWSSLDLVKRGRLMIFSVAAMLLVRPHMASIMVIALVFAVVFDSKASFLKKLLLSVISLVGAAIMIPFALRYAGFGGLVSIELFTEYIDQRQLYNTDGGGGVNIASMSLPVQLFTYLFRPVIFEARSVFALAASIDNLILLVLFVIGGFSLFSGKKSGLGENRVFMWVYVLGSWLILAMTTANLGIALRQKWMFAPMLIFLFISIIGRRRQVIPNNLDK